MIKIEIKIGGKVFKISEKDLVLDNGSCAQLITQHITKGWDQITPVMSKKMFRDMKKQGLLRTSEELKQKSIQRYGLGRCTLYAFDIPAMLDAGYKSVPEKNS